MATARPSPPASPPPIAQAAEAVRNSAPASAASDLRPGAGEDNAGPGRTLVPVAPAGAIGGDGKAEGQLIEPPDAAIDGPVARLPVELDVVVPVREFRVRHLLALEPGELIESQWNYGDDVPLAAGDVQLAWSEFEVLENRLAVRITRLP
jgi:flagellar motor switch/type III secretory pathway protein FliN